MFRECLSNAAVSVPKECTLQFDFAPITMRIDRHVSNHKKRTLRPSAGSLLSCLVKHSDAHVQKSRGKPANGRNDRWMRFFQTLNRKTQPCNAVSEAARSSIMTGAHD
jgi:enamine deaminase RidA (YjgF/YER057c/UK114 family)